MKRHLKIRHHIHVEDMQALEKLSGASQVTQVMPADGDGSQVANEIGLQVGVVPLINYFIVLIHN